MSTAIATNDDDVIVPLSFSRDKGAYISAIVAFDGVCVCAFAEGQQGKGHKGIVHLGCQV